MWDLRWTIKLLIKRKDFPQNSHDFVLGLNGCDDGVFARSDKFVVDVVIGIVGDDLVVEEDIGMNDDGGVNFLAGDTDVPPAGLVAPASCRNRCE